jgi:hypothetical protein
MYIRWAISNKVEIQLQIAATLCGLLAKQSWYTRAKFDP